ncbi:MAG TPA: transketolase, partial [Dehalococcoidia bacterium]|nr:transketolase [Dehalococcoidia bacterium]
MERAQELDIQELKELARQLRVDSVRMAATASSGHPTSSMSSADLMAVLLARHLHYDFSNPDDPHNDRLVFSKGHASPLLYSLYKAAGVVSEEELQTYRSAGSRLQGHPTPALPWVDVATGSLGQGLPVGVGLALTGKFLDRLPYRVWVLCGDSEMAEGSMWEAFEHAAFYGLDNLTAIIDVNRLGQRGETMHGWDLSKYAERARAFGWHAIEIDGHDLSQVHQAYTEAQSIKDRPSVVIARTVKGSGVSAVEDQNGFHGKSIEDSEKAIEELGGPGNLIVQVAGPSREGVPHQFPAGGEQSFPTYKVGDELPTRDAFGEALTALGSQRGDVVVLDGEIGDSTRAEFFAEAYPDRFFQMYISEQQMVAAATGMQARHWMPFAATFAAFMTRAHDFIRMAAISRANLRLVGSHAGVAIGQDGPSQMGLEDLAMFRAVAGSTVLYPCDANQTSKLVAQMADRDGIVYLRTTRGSTPVIYDEHERFLIGGSKVLRATADDDVVLIGAGITTHQALQAAHRLEQQGVRARVIDLYSIKPVDKDTLLEAAAATQGPVITVEDHWPEGGLGDAVLEALADAPARPRVIKLAVRDLPG